MSKTPIDPEDIRVGDLIRFEFTHEEGAREYRATDDCKVWSSAGKHYLLDRPKPKVKLPSEPGVYLPYTYANGNTPNVWLLDRIRGWIELPNVAGVETKELDPAQLTRNAKTITRLEPVPTTAKKVLDDLKYAIGPFMLSRESYQRVRACIDHVAQQFKVTD